MLTTRTANCFPLFRVAGVRLTAYHFVPGSGQQYVRKRIAVCATSIALLRELTCHNGSHSITCHPAEVTFPPLPQPIKAGTRLWIVITYSATKKWNSAHDRIARRLGCLLAEADPDGSVRRKKSVVAFGTRLFINWTEVLKCDCYGYEWVVWVNKYTQMLSVAHVAISQHLLSFLVTQIRYTLVLFVV